MKILHLISSGGLYGAESMMIQLAEELSKRGPYYSLVGVIENSHNPHREVADEASKKGINAVCFPCNGRFDPRVIFQLRRFLVEKDIAVIHSHGYKSNIYAFLASRGLSRRLVATCHNWLGSDRKMRLYAAMDRFLLRSFDAIVAVSEQVKSKIVNSGVPPHRVRMISNGISVDAVLAVGPVGRIRSALAIPDDAKVIGTVGRISEEKGHEYLLRAAEGIVKKYPATVFLIIGDGPLRDDLQRRFGSPSIIFTGMRRDIPDLLSIMDLFVLPSLTEGLPMALLEAMAASVPVVATSVGEVPTVIDTGKSGIVVDPGNSEALRLSLEYLLTYEERARQMGKEGKKILNDRFSSKDMAVEYGRLYQSITMRDSRL